MNNPLLIRYLHARPASSHRIPLSLPPSWPPPLKKISTGDEVIYEQWKESNAPLPQKTASKNDIAKKLAHPFLEEIIAALLSDIQVWALDGTEKNARWVAEQLILKVYKNWELDSDFLLENYNKSRNLSNEFYDLVPDFEPMYCYPVRQVLNPNGSVDLWTALYAFNVFRFEFIDMIHVSESSQILEDEFQYLEPTNMCEKLLLNSARIREHAVFAFLFRAQKLLKSFHISSETLLKRQITKTSSLANLHSLVKVMIGNMHAFRLLINNNKISVLCELIKNTGCWCSTRSPSMIVLTCCDDHELFKAAMHYEIACIRECMAMTKLFYSNDIVAQFMEDEELALDTILKKSFLKINICLKSQDESVDNRIFNGFSEVQKACIQAYNYEGFYYARPSIAFPSFVRVLSSIVNDSDTPLHLICRFVVSDKSIDLLRDCIDGIDPKLFADFFDNTYLDEADVSIQNLYKIVREEADKRVKFEGNDSDSFLALQYTENELLTYAAVAKKRRWES